MYMDMGPKKGFWNIVRSSPPWLHVTSEDEGSGRVARIPYIHSVQVNTRNIRSKLFHQNMEFSVSEALQIHVTKLEISA